MKTLVIFAASILIAQFSFGQSNVINEQPRFEYKRYHSIQDYLSKNIEFSPNLRCYEKEGTIVVQFNVTSTGDVADFKVINGICPPIDAYVVNTLETTGGKWIPGTINGKPATIKEEVSVAFLLNSHEHILDRVKTYQRKGNRWLFEKNNPKKALKFYNKGIAFLPYEESLLATRSLCKHELGDLAGAQTDWNRLQELAKREKLEANIEEVAELPEKVEEFLATMKSKSENR